MATVTATIPPGRFGSLSIDNDSSVIEFIEKPKGDNVYINGGFFVLSKKIIDKARINPASFDLTTTVIGIVNLK